MVFPVLRHDDPLRRMLEKNGINRISPAAVALPGIIYTQIYGFKTSFKYFPVTIRYNKLRKLKTT